MAMRDSVLGVGIDISGSIRIPSMCCGVIGFKPSTRRVPFGGQTSLVRQGGLELSHQLVPFATRPEMPTIS